MIQSVRKPGAVGVIRGLVGGHGGALHEFNRRSLYRPATPTMAFRIAKLAGVGVDDVLAGRFPAPGTCPQCGHHEE